MEPHGQGLGAGLWLGQRRQQSLLKADPSDRLFGNDRVQNHLTYFTEAPETLMKLYLKCAALVLGSLIVVEPALARGGGSNFMNSPGYQRRLQESRGFVTTYSNGYPQRGPLYQYRHRNRR